MNGLSKMNIESREVTYRQVIEQVFFKDESELIIKTGWAEGQEADLDVTYEWVGEEPEWAKGKSIPSLLEESDPSQESMSYSELAELTHATQVERFNWCSCEEQETFPYADCPVKTICEDCDAVAVITIQPYGEGKMAVYNCPNCGESYDTNYDGAGL